MYDWWHNYNRFLVFFTFHSNWATSPAYSSHEPTHSFREVFPSVDPIVATWVFPAVVSLFPLIMLCLLSPTRLHPYGRGQESLRGEPALRKRGWRYRSVPGTGGEPTEGAPEERAQSRPACAGPGSPPGQRRPGGPGPPPSQPFARGPSGRRSLTGQRAAVVQRDRTQGRGLQAPGVPLTATGPGLPRRASGLDGLDSDSEARPISALASLKEPLA